ncbi:MAG TPA: NAD-dependent dihydropyrimidine dehydrogenase subunit PreA [Kiritimatiellia bacterium]|nr:NAD-dependent dihydropyrimidine dehydrogenase subunit PreA [Kiritimatiellia bacterium]HMO99777.1 NAD-dependent dihydropyrimidine dehydrogenase subunit PreA [Kiritimatiellia bacterium]HMP97243.1 NAD-dependent dihydropyrimidine dehydrogenase subunit PreA [Kiritimatiellia bacterium]
MADLSINLAGIKSPNPFWVASAPPSNTAYQSHRAFEAGWGGVVWKTIGDPIVNVSSRYSSHDLAGQRMVGFNNIELISDRTPETNFREIREVKDRWPHHAVIASLMTDTRENWHDMMKRSADAGADGVELNFGCPHGMCERGMGSAVGQNPDVIEAIVGWVMEAAEIPVIVKLTPNITDITQPARAAKRAGADAISMINTINSITQVNLDTMCPEPYVAGKSTHGGYCGPAVKPIALNMVHCCAADPLVQLPISGIGGISTWKDAAEFIALGSTSVQVCTAIMHYGFRIVEDMIDGLNDFLDGKGYASVNELRGKAVRSVDKWETLNLNYKRVAEINYDKCIGCNLCYIACEDGAHQAIDLITPDGYGLGPGRLPGKKIPQIIEDHCVGCNLCSIVCPVDNCITMVDRDTGKPFMSWKDYQEKLAKGEMERIPAHP